MGEKVTFEQLLATVGRANMEELRARKEKLEKKRAELQARLAEVQKELQEVEQELQAPLREALKAAKILGIEVPAEYQKPDNGNGKNHGKYYWEAKGQIPFKAEVSRAMWRLSQGSGGSAGKNGEGVLTVQEFWALVGLKPEELELGRTYEVRLPNGREIKFQKLEE